MKRVATILFAGAILVLAQSSLVLAQTKPASTLSASGETTSAPSGGGTDKRDSQATAKQAAHHKKKKSSFMHKMRDKAMEKVQKLFGSKQESNLE
jgi:hypothetical protein